ncbi:MAG: type I DNA topoisomerase [Elusimicrobia bacterium]|nr:type I DNA topoisomerase [Elusimicrobiota bacterium]
MTKKKPSPLKRPTTDDQRPALSTGQSLVIVESPTKEKTIAGFLDKGFLVKSCMGHIRDLPQKEFGIDLKHDFAPQYVVIAGKDKILNLLKSLAKKSARIILATDYDREGEAIAWHLIETLKPPPEKISRVVFHEITKEAIIEAMKTPRSLDEKLVSAQQARRVLDRIVGYKLSPLLWKKVRQGLSAGRVQSVAARLVIEREAEIKAFTIENYWTIRGLFQKTGGSEEPVAAPFSAELIRYQDRDVEETQIHRLFAQTYKVQTTIFKDAQKAAELAEALRSRRYQVSGVEESNRRRYPPPPFITSTLTQSASQALSFPAQMTMRLAQNLYEIGLITYMRTDSVQVAQSARDQARQFIEKEFGGKYLAAAPRLYRTKVKGAQEAHEAIRPTSVVKTPEALRPLLKTEEASLYDLIWRRFMAGQMAEAVYHVMAVTIEAAPLRSASGTELRPEAAAAGPGETAILRASGRRLVFEGFLKLYREETEPENESQAEALPALKAGDPLDLAAGGKGVVAASHQTPPPPRYNEASLIRTLEEHGIGRPSTYAPIIQTIVDRGYAFLKERRFYPSEIGIVVTQMLKLHFPEIVSLSFTAKMEKGLDQIAEGKNRWQGIVKEFYTPFISKVEKAQNQITRVTMEPKDSGQKCSTCGGRLFVKESRFGQYLLCENNPKTCRMKIPLDAQGNPIIPETTNEPCPKCGKTMLKKRGIKGLFYLACPDYPACKTSFSLDKKGNKIIRQPPQATDFKCEKCGQPLLKRFGRHGPFLACSAFPKCRFTKSLPPPVS